MKSPIPTSPTVVHPLTKLKKGMNWQPVQGEHATAVAVRSGIDKEASAALIESAAQILGSGVDPKLGKGSATGLVVGYVQSGKTLSFTTVIGMARDNGFPLVILVAGNKTSLLTQSHDRLKRDLDVGGGDGLPAWILAQNPRTQDSQYEQLIQQAIENWRDPSLDADERPTLLLTVLKQNQRLASLTKLLSRLKLEGIPALIIDDEADQASLNTRVNQNDESTTYTRLRELRAALPCHTFLQYTATPQAPLLVNIADTLSPDFVHVLAPGTGYVGGEVFFAPNSPYVETIPAGDIAMLNAGQDDPPQSLLEAMSIFFVGLAAGVMEKSARKSMLIHPARETVVHQESVAWARATKERWKVALTLPKTDPDRLDAVQDFQAAYDELSSTHPTLPPFDVLLEKGLPRALRNTTVIEFNARGTMKTPDIGWNYSEGWILVGGQAVDRGFTVESLSVTYMPRGTGVGNADTLQQRARFFGYKRKYLGLCRVYLEQDLQIAFQEYIDHEQIMRAELRRLADVGDNLRTWRRRLVLDPSLQPCRRSVISDPLSRAAQGGGWLLQRGALLDSDNMSHNSKVLQGLVTKLKFKTDESYKSKSAAQIHEVALDVPVTAIVDALVDYRLEDQRDTAGFTGLLVTIGELLRKDPEAKIAVYRMRPSAAGERQIADESGSIENFLQGRTELASGKLAYPGDAFFKATDTPSIQLHAYSLRQKGKIVAKTAPLLAIYVPPALAKSWLVQIQSGQK